MAEMIKIKSTTADGFEFGAYHADAQGKRKGGVVVIQEIFGIDQYVRADVERWAKAGFEAIAPAWSPFLLSLPAELLTGDYLTGQDGPDSSASRATLEGASGSQSGIRRLASQYGRHKDTHRARVSGALPLSMVSILIRDRSCVCNHCLAIHHSSGEQFRFCALSI